MRNVILKALGWEISKRMRLCVCLKALNAMLRLLLEKSPILLTEPFSSAPPSGTFSRIQTTAQDNTLRGVDEDHTLKGATKL